MIENDRRTDRHPGVEHPPPGSESPLDSSKKEASGGRRGVGRPSVVEQFRRVLGAILQADPRMKTSEILHRMRQAGYPGGKSVLYEMVRSMRRRDLPPLATLESLPGILSQHDFGAVVVHYTTGGRERIRFLVSRLSYSRYLDVRLMPDDGIESLIRGLLAAFESFGGVPLVAVFDNPRTVTLEQEGLRIRWDETFGRAAVDYRFAPELRAAREANASRATRLTEIVRGRFFRARRFEDRDDVRSQLDAWLRDFNKDRPGRSADVTRFSRLAAERDRLRPLAIPPDAYALCFPVVVGPTALVEFQGWQYAMPPEASGSPGLLWLYPDHVRIVAGRHQSEHERLHETRRGSRPGKPAGSRHHPHTERPSVDDSAATEIVLDRRFMKTVTE